MKCSKEVSVNEAHTFAGYGFFIAYHPQCCPREVDGWNCEEDHPEENQKLNQDSHYA
jgi:hypothetical protein